MKIEDLQSLIEKYVIETASNEERTTLEQLMVEDPAIKEEVDFTLQMMANYGETTWDNSPVAENSAAELKTFFESDQAIELNAALEAAKNNASKKPSHKPPEKKSSTWKIIVAIIAILGALFFSYLFLKPTEKTPDVLFAENVVKSELPSFTQKGNNTKISTVNRLYKAGEYKEVLSILEQIPAEYESGAIIYRGLSHIGLDQFDLAKQEFFNLKNSDFLDADQADWFLALIDLKEGKVEAAKVKFSTMAQNTKHPYHSESLEILKHF